MEATIEQECYGSLSLLCGLGDITISWDERNKEAVLAMIRKKMDEGYTFFTTKKYLFGKVRRKSEITKKDLKKDNLEDIIITDEQFEKMVSDMDDMDVATLVKNKEVDVVKRVGKKDMTALKKAKCAEDVIAGDSLALRPIRGG